MCLETVSRTETGLENSITIYDKTKIFKGKSSSELFNAKMLQKAMYLDFPDLGQVTKFNPKMQDFKRVLDLT